MWRLPLLLVAVLLLAMSCGGDDDSEATPAPAEEAADGSVTVELHEENGSGQSGTATFTPTEDGFKVIVEVSPQDRVRAQHGNISTGTCDEPDTLYAVVEASSDDPLFTSDLAPVRNEGGQVTLDELQAGDFIVLVVDEGGSVEGDIKLLSTPGFGTFALAACGEIPRQ